MGRFISPDTIVPEPGSSGGFNRYRYTRNNPLKYVDPSGHLSEDQIKNVFGVETWDEVLSNFETGGEFEGRWGWLETLRDTNEGQVISISDNTRIVAGSRTGSEIYRGRLKEIDGQFYLQGYKGRYKSTSISIKLAGTMGNLHTTKYNTLQWVGNDDGALPIHSTDADWKTNHLKFDPSKVSWGNVAWDSASTIASLFAANEVVQGIKHGPKIQNVAKSVGPAMSGTGVIKSLLVDLDPNAAWLSAGSFVPGPVGGGFSVGSVFHDLQPGFSYEP